MQLTVIHVGESVPLVVVFAPFVVVFAPFVVAFAAVAGEFAQFDFEAAAAPVGAAGRVSKGTINFFSVETCRKNQK